MIDASLHDTTAMSVTSYLGAVATDSIVDELIIVTGQSVQASLNDVIAIQVLDQHHTAFVQSFSGEFDLLRSIQVLKHLLHSSSTMHV